MEVVRPAFERVSYGAAVSADSPLRERITVALPELVESGAYDRWYGATTAAED